jgi:small subunit ribosomal protein S13
MIRIAGTNLSPKKNIRFALTPVKGVGKSNVRQILTDLQIPETIKLGDLDEQAVIKLRNHIESTLLVEADLRRSVQADIKRLTDIGSWRGLRHKAGLPVRGQTTKTNSRTRRGNTRKTGGSGRTKAAAKT